jgi:hypothetical protein
VVRSSRCLQSNQRVRLLVEERANRTGCTTNDLLVSCRIIVTLTQSDNVRVPRHPGVMSQRERGLPLQNDCHVREQFSSTDGDLL